MNRAVVDDIERMREKAFVERNEQDDVALRTGLKTS